MEPEPGDAMIMSARHTFDINFEPEISEGIQASKFEQVYIHTSKVFTI